MFQVEGHTLIFHGGHRRKFADVIAEAIDFDDLVVVRLGTEAQRSNENVYGVDRQGNLLWQIPKRSHSSAHSPYVGIYRHGPHVEAFNWDGQNLIIHPRTGLVMSESTPSFETYTRRPRPTRRLM